MLFNAHRSASAPSASVRAGSARPGRASRAALTAGLVCTLALSGSLTCAPSPAYAATAETLAELSRLQGEVEAAASTYTEATAQADALNKQVADIADEILALEQDELPRLQSRAANAASNLYKNRSGTSNALTLLLSADSFADVISLGKYLATIQDENVSALKELNALEDELNSKLVDLSAAKEQADAEAERASNALAQAQSAAAQVQQKANSEDAAEAELARKAAEQAAALEAQQKAAEADQGSSSEDSSQGTTQGSGTSQNQGGSSGNAGTSNGGSSASGGSNAGSSSNGGSSSSGGSNSNAGSNTSSGSWKSGVASYYGIGDGFMGGTTASGAIVTETSMGVAMLNVPLGTRVEIRYGGRSVIAVVNDRGPYVHGRVIDMQPAVARALNFLNVGVATVEYRFL